MPLDNNIKIVYEFDVMGISKQMKRAEMMRLTDSNTLAMDKLLSKTLDNSLVPLSLDVKEKLLYYTLYQILKNSITGQKKNVFLSEEELELLINKFLYNLSVIEDPSETSLEEMVMQLKVQIESLQIEESNVERGVEKKATFADLYGMFATGDTITEDEIKAVQVTIKQLEKNLH